MTLYLYLFILFVNLILSFRNRGSKLVTVVTLIMIVLFIGNAGPGYLFWSDYDNYTRLYENAHLMSLSDSLQISYTILMKAGSFLKLDFFMFRIILTAICLLIIYKYIIKRYGYNSNYILLLYLIYPMIIDSEQFRNFIAMTILLVAITFLERSWLRDKIKFLVLVLIATTIHTSFIFYTCLVFVNSKDKNKLIKAVAILTLCLSLIIFLNNNQIPYLQSIIDLIEVDKAEKYLSTNTEYGFLIPFILQFTSIFLLIWAKRIITKYNSFGKNIVKSNSKTVLNFEREIKDIKFTRLVLWINILSIAFFPLFIMNVHFYRLCRNLLILNFIVYSIASNRMKVGSPNRIIFNLTIISSVVFWLIMDLVVKTSSERLLIPFFSQNLFFN